MNRKRSKFFKGLGAVVLTLAMLITMLPVTEAWADQAEDYTPPVVEYASVKEANQTIKLGDDITLQISVYDADSAIKEIVIELYDGESYGWLYACPDKTSDDNYYELTVPVEVLYLDGECDIISVTVYDLYNNETIYNIGEKITVEKDYYTGSSAIVTFGSEEYARTDADREPVIDFDLSISGVEGIDCAYGLIYNETEDYMYSDVYMSLDPTYDNGFTLGATAEGYFSFNDIVFYKDGKYYFVENINENGFEYVNRITDVYGPTVTNVTMDKKGEFVESGKVTVTINAEDPSGLENYARVWLQSPVSYIDNYRYFDMTSVSMSEDGKSATFDIEINVAGLNPCEWYISEIGVQDIYGNITWVRGYEDYYFFVNGEGFIEKTYSNVNVYLEDEDGNTLASYSGTLPRRAKVGDIFGDKWIDELEDSPELGKFLGWTYNGEIVTKDSIILIENNDDYISITPKYEKQKIIVHYSCLHQDDSAYGYESIITDKAITYGELMKMVECPENDMYTFTGWKTYEDDEAYVTDSNVSLYATYDKYPITLHVAYLDENNNIKEIIDEKDYSAGTTFGQILSECNPNIEKWLYSGMLCNNLDTEISIQENEIEANAYYADKQIIQYSYSWIADSDESTEYGESGYENGYMLVNKETALSIDALAEAVDTIVKPDCFDKLTSDGYSAYTNNYDNDSYADEIYLYAEYDQSYVNLYGDYNSKLDRYVYDRYYVVEPGDTFYLPEEYNGEKVYWNYEDNNEYYTGSFVIPEDDDEGCWYYFYIETELPEGAVLHENETITPSAPTPTPEDKPVVEMEEEKVVETTNKIEEAIKEAEKNEAATGETKPVQVVVDMKKEDGTVATVVPVEILEAAKGQNVEVVLDMGDYSWTINGNDIKATNLKDINLEVELNTNNIPSATVEKLAKGQETHQLSLTHNGDFGFKAELTINVGKDNEGQYGNLYYYDSDGKLVFMNAGKIDENGNVSLSFSHASEYVVVISDKPVVADTGDNTNIALYVCMLLAGAGLMVVSLRKRNTF